jgi:uncharacterized membrane protein YgcG
VILCLVALLVALIAFGRRPRLTARGKAVLAHLEAENARLADVNESDLGAPDVGTMLPLAVGLFGLGALSHTALAGLESDLEPLAPRRSLLGDSSGGTTGCGSSDSSSGDSGGGGSGCGGCGRGGGD